MKIRPFVTVASLVSLMFVTQIHAQSITLRFGHFPNITHAQGVIAHHFSRQGHGWFEERLGSDVQIGWYVYNAGPSAMEAILANALDVTYVGPNPAINAHVKSQSEEIRIVAGSANGGAGLVVHPEAKIQSPEDFRGKRIATPQLGNTQDVACRSWLKAQGYHITQIGGDVSILPTPNADQLSLFVKADIDAVWTVEPWVSRLELEGNGRLYLEEPDTITTVLVSSTRFLDTHPDLVRQIVDAHIELTAWIRSHPQEAQQIIQAELTEETTREMPLQLIQHAWPRLHFTHAVSPNALKNFVTAAQDAGFLRGTADVSQLIAVP